MSTPDTAPHAFDARAIAAEAAERGDDELATVIGQLIGFASMCWEITPAGVFDSTSARQALDATLEWLRWREAPSPAVRTSHPGGRPGWQGAPRP